MDPAGCAPFSAELSYVDSDCRYGDQVVNATLANFDPLTLSWWARAPVYGGDAAATNVSCLSPPRADARSLDLEVSLNGQQYTLDRFGFVFYREIVLSSLHPLSGPREGGTTITWQVVDGANGTDYRCRFFGASALAGGESVASLSASGMQVACVTPNKTYAVPPAAPPPPALQMVEVVDAYLSKNGQVRVRARVRGRVSVRA